MKTALRLAILSAAAALGAACVTLGRPFDAAQVKSIAVGKTTQGEIQKLFGDPTRTGLDSGDPTWTYLDYSLSLFGERRITDLLVKFGPDGTVKSYSYNTNAR